MKSIRILYTAFVLLCILSCTNDEIQPNETGELTLEFDNHIGEEDLELNTVYENSAGESFSLTTLNYFISNISLKTIDGIEYIVPQDSSYFLVKEDDAESQEVTIKNIPAGDYNEITFTIGVDSVRSKMDVSKRTGVLDPEQSDMYWSLKSGYIFFKMEGESPVAPADHKFNYHIGGYGGYDTPEINNIRKKTITMGSARAEIRSNKSPEVHLHVDVLEAFSNPETISIAEHSSVMLSEYSRVVSANYVNMFEFDHVHN